MFCYKLFIFGDGTIPLKRWKREKGGEKEVFDLLTDVGCIIEYT